MPELAEVEFYRKQWDPGCDSQILKVDLHPSARVFRDTDPAQLAKGLTRSVLVSSEAHGKQMLFRFSPEGWLSLHLGMTGSMHLAAQDHQPEKHDHLVLRQTERSLIFRDPRLFGRVVYYPGPEVPAFWKALPPAILSRSFTQKRLEAFLSRHPKSVIKALLLDQQGFPGIGNWMADELLWRIGLHPATRCAEIPSARVPQMWRELKALCRVSLDTIGVDWSDPPDSWLFNHRWKDGGICPRRGCRIELIRETIRGRTTCWCPRCQAAPRP